MTASPELAAGLRVEVPTIDDGPAMMQLRTAVWREEASVSGVSPSWVRRYTLDWDSPESIQQYQQYVAESLTDDTAYLRVAKQGDQVTAIFDADTVDKASGRAYVRVIQLLPHVRRQGLGSHLMAGFEQAIDPERAIQLEVLYRNMRARHFYDRLGFREVPGSFRTEYRVLDKISMIKQRGAVV